MNHTWKYLTGEILANYAGKSYWWEKIWRINNSQCIYHTHTFSMYLWILMRKILANGSRFAIRQFFPLPKFSCVRYYFLHIHTFYHALLVHAISVYALIIICQRMVVNLLAAYKGTNLHAAHKVLLSCITQSHTCVLLTIVQHMKHSSHAVHEIWLACSTQSLTCVQHSVSHTSFEWVAQQKLKNTCVFGAHECQLSCELYSILENKWRHVSLYKEKMLLTH